MNQVVRLGLVPTYLVLCLVLGGASGGGYWANMTLQLLAIPIIIWGMVVHRSAPLATAGRQLFVLIALAALLIALQLIPLPPSVWTSLPGRDQVAKGFELTGQPLPWAPISLAPFRTVASALWALPALGILFGMLRLGLFKAKWLAWGLFTVTAIGIGIGALQLSQGPDSPLYFYRFTNWGRATGFFANTNNMANLMVVTIPFVAAIYLSTSRGVSVQKRSGLLIVAIGALAVLAVGIGVNQSLAGIGLAIPTIAASGLMILFRNRQLPIWGAATIAALLVGSITLVLSGPFGNNLTADEAAGASDSRYTSFTKTITAAQDYFPVGTGLGTFTNVYPMYEDSAQVTRTYMNHAHNDYLELALEVGLPGLFLVGAFLAWWGWRVAAAWRAHEPDHFARAATIGSAVILAHSFVEFPLRTAAIGAVFAACCGLIAEARPRVRRRASAHHAPPQARHLSAD